MPRPPRVRSEDEVGSEANERAPARKTHARVTQRASTCESNTVYMSLNGDTLPCEDLPNYSIFDAWNSWQWYILVFKPLNSNYDQAYNAMDWIRKKFCVNTECWLITKECNAKKIHWNLLAYTEEDLAKYHELRSPRYMVYAQKVKTTPRRAYDYITKEYYLDGFPWKKYIDFNYYLKNKISVIINGNEEIDKEDSDGEAIEKALKSI